MINQMDDAKNILFEALLRILMALTLLNPMYFLVTPEMNYMWKGIVFIFMLGWWIWGVIPKLKQAAKCEISKADFLFVVEKTIKQTLGIMLFVSAYIVCIAFAVIPIHPNRTLEELVFGGIVALILFVIYAKTWKYLPIRLQ